MSVWLHFEGWFQCRLATDPDPCDEPRGVSGYARALADEPDLDRRIRLQPPHTVPRSFCPTIGVSVGSVVVDDAPAASHPLVGARVDLLDDARFEGRNGIVADAGFEPIVPFHLQVAREGFALRRRHRDQETFPFTDLQATGVQPGRNDVADATGIHDLGSVWRERRTDLERVLDTTQDEASRVALEERIRMLGSRRLAGFFPARMLYSVALEGAASFADPDGWLAGAPDTDRPWLVDFWLGGWDPDALCGYMRGALVFDLTQRPGVRAEEAGEAPGLASAGLRAPRRP